MGHPGCQAGVGGRERELSGVSTDSPSRPIAEVRFGIRAGCPSWPWVLRSRWLP